MPILLKDLALKALTAGKYLNVVHGLGDKSSRLPEQKLSFDRIAMGDHSEIYASIDSAYAFSSRALLHLLVL